MPITSPVSFPRLTAAEMCEIDYEVMKYAFNIHRELGRLCDERIYQADLAARLGHVRREMQVVVSFRSFSKTYELDLVVCVFVTTLAAERSAHHEAHLRRLLNHSPLARAHWINIDLHEIHFVTLEAKP